MNIIKVNLENAQEELKELLLDYSDGIACILKNVEADYFAKYNPNIVTPNELISISFVVKGFEENGVQIIQFQRIHSQYDFDNKVFYGFFVVSEFGLNDEEFSKYASRKSRGMK